MRCRVAVEGADIDTEGRAAVAVEDIDTEGDRAEDVVEAVVGANKDDRWSRKGVQMKIAVTSKGEGLDSPVDQRFGRARGFIIADVDSGELEWVDNEQNLNAAQGAGIQAAENVSRHGVAYVVTGHCGPKAFRTLAAAGIEVIIGVDGTVGGAVEKFKAGELSPADGADVGGHWA